MKCEECSQLIEIFFDGELDKRAAKEVSAHISACSLCEDTYQSLQNEQDFYSGAFSGVDVSPFFWATVEEKVKAEKSATPFRRFVNSVKSFSIKSFNPVPLAALCLLLMVISGGAVWLIRNSETDAMPKDVAKVSKTELPKIETANVKNNNERREKESPKNKLPIAVKTSNVVASNSGRKNIESDEQLTDNIAKRAEKKYLEAIALLSRDINRRRQQLDPEAAEQFKKTLVVVDRTIQNTRQAVRENPDDPVAVQYMLSAYAQKVDVLRGLMDY